MGDSNERSELSTCGRCGTVSRVLVDCNTMKAITNSVIEDCDTCRNFRYPVGGEDVEGYGRCHLWHPTDGYHRAHKQDWCEHYAWREND